LRGEPSGTADGNLFIDHFCGAAVHALPVTQYRTGFDAVLEARKAALTAAGKKPYFIPTGASDGIGVWGYVNAAEELLGDCERAGFLPDAIVHATGSGGTQAGLLAGLALQGVDIPVWGVNVCDDRAYFERKIARDLADWQQRYRPAAVPTAESIRILEGYMGPGYGKTTEALRDVLRQAACRGLLLDPVYSGKAFQALLAESTDGIFSTMKHVVFVHTGGFFGALDHRSELLTKG
jgi:D-cysteine desulfhydrase